MLGPVCRASRLASTQLLCTWSGLCGGSAVRASHFSTKTVLLLGAPGSGKGTYAGMLTREWGERARVVGSGDLIRAEIQSDTAQGRAFKEYAATGALIPDDEYVSYMQDKLFHAEHGILNKSESESEVIFLDGYPRSIAQAEALNRGFAEKHATSNTTSASGIDLVLELHLPEDVIIEKLVNRRVCPECGHSFNLAHVVDEARGLHMPAMMPAVSGKCDFCEDVDLVTRPDDNKEVIEKRLQAYADATNPLIEFYQSEACTHVSLADGSTHTLVQPQHKVVSVAMGADNVYPELRELIVDLCTPRKDTLYYDDACPICTVEMDKLAKHHGAGLKLQPITSLPEENQAAMRSELHMQTEDGKWVVGLEANVRAWQHTRYGNVASLMLHPALRWAAELGYRSWLVWYQWMRRRREAKL